MASVFDGMPELEKAFKSLELVAQKKILTKAIRAGGEVIREEASRRAPRDTGALSEGMTMRVRDADVNSVFLDVGPGKDEFYGIFLEYGTVHHPAQPFLQPSLEDKGVEAENKMGEVLADEIRKITGGTG